MVAIKQAASEFLANKRIAVTGVSRNPKGHGANVVYQRLKDRGYEVVAINPNADRVEGDRCYPDLKSVPGDVEAVVIGTRPDIAETTMRECVDLGIEQVWMHRGPGAGASPSRDGVRARTRGYRDRRWLPVHVRPNRGRRPQDDEMDVRPERQRAQASVTLRSEDLTRPVAQFWRCYEVWSSSSTKQGAWRPSHLFTSDNDLPPMIAPHSARRQSSGVRRGHRGGRTLGPGEQTGLSLLLRSRKVVICPEESIRGSGPREWGIQCSAAPKSKQ